MSLKEELPIPIEDLRRRVLHVEPNAEFLSRLTNCGDTVLLALLDEPGLERWQTALRKIFLDPILVEIRKNFQDNIGVGFANISTDREKLVPFLSDKGVVIQEKLLDLESLFLEGSDRPHKWHLEVDSIDNSEMRDYRLFLYSKILLGYYFGAAKTKTYHEALRNVQPIVCVYDLSLLTKSEGKRDFRMPGSSEVRRKIIRAVYPFDVTLLLPQEL